MKLPSPKLLQHIGWRDHVAGAALGLVYAVWLAIGARAVGFPRDEGVYFRAGSGYARWVRLLFDSAHEALQPSIIDSSWSGMGNNAEHPALMKTLFGLSAYFFHDKWRVFADASAAFRLPAMILAGVSLWTIYLFGARAWSRRAGIVAAMLYALMPRVFFHAHLACFDVPMATMWLLVVYVHWRAQQERRWTWAIAAGVVFGLALDTKHNAWILPAVVVPHAIVVHRHAIVRALKAGRVSIPSSLVSMAILSPLVLYALWPNLWNDTLGRAEWYVTFHLHHEYYNIEYLGRNYFGAPSPRSYLPVMVLATVPTVTLLLFAVGTAERAANAIARIRGKAPPDKRHTDLLLALALLAAVSPWILSSKTPVFGGTKHWLPAYPALALLAGRGFDVVASAMRRALSRLDAQKLALAELALGACVVASPLAITAHSHPFGLASYVPIVGGTKGGADLGLNRQFWGYTSQDAAAEYLNANAPRGATVFIHDTTWEAWSRMQEEGRVRSDLRAVGSPHEAMFALVEHELHMNEVDYSIWVADGTDAPAYVVTQDGVPIVSVYRRP